MLFYFRIVRVTAMTGNPKERNYVYFSFIILAFIVPLQQGWQWQRPAMEADL